MQREDMMQIQLTMTNGPSASLHGLNFFVLGNTYPNTNFAFLLYEGFFLYV